MTDGERAYAQQWLIERGLDDAGPLIGVHPGASAPDRCYPESRYADALSVLADEFGGHVLLFGSPSDAKRVSAIEKALRVPFTRTDGIALREMMALMSRCRLILANDSGPMHIANALNTPTVCVFGPGDHIRWMPPRPNAVMVRPDSPTETRVSTIPTEHLIDAGRQLLTASPT